MVDINTLVHIHPYPFGAINPEAERIRPWQVRIMRKHNSFAIGTIDHGLDDVAVFVVNLFVFMARRKLKKKNQQPTHQTTKRKQTRKAKTPEKDNILHA